MRREGAGECWTKTGAKGQWGEKLGSGMKRKKNEDKSRKSGRSRRPDLRSHYVTAPYLWSLLQKHLKILSIFGMLTSSHPIFSSTHT